MTNLALNLTESAGMYPQRTAVREGDVTLTYAQLDDLASRLAALAASRGVKPGSRVGVMLPNVVAFPVVAYGILRAGGIVVPMNPLLKHREVEYYLSDSGAELVFADRKSVV